MKKLYLVLISVFFFGCAHQVVGVDKVVVLPEEKIYTLKAGSQIDLVFDKKEIKGITFPSDMFVVSSTVLVRQEERLNNLAMEKVKTEKNKNKLITILGSILGVVTAGFTAFAKLNQGSKKT